MPTDTPTLPVAGAPFHVLAGGIILFGQVLTRGQTFSLTQEQIDGALDRYGEPTVGWLTDPEAQTARWGRVVIAPGPWEGGETWIKGDPNWEIARRAAVTKASAIVDPDERIAAFRAINAKFGHAPSGVTWVDRPAAVAASGRWE